MLSIIHNKWQLFIKCNTIHTRSLQCFTIKKNLVVAVVTKKKECHCKPNIHHLPPAGSNFIGLPWLQLRQPANLQCPLGSWQWSSVAHTQTHPRKCT